MLKIIISIFATVIVVALATTPNLLPMGFQTDKILHIFVFAITSAYITWQYIEQRNKLIILLGAVLCAGIAIELIQMLIPERTAQIEDIAANIIGILYGLTMGNLLKKGYYAKPSKRMDKHLD